MARDYTLASANLPLTPRAGAPHPSSPRFAGRGRTVAGPRAAVLDTSLERQSQPESRAERQLVRQRVAVVRVLHERGAREVLGVGQVRRLAVHDRGGHLEGVVVVGEGGFLLI